MNEIVITGSTGVLGRRTVQQLQAAGQRVTGIVRSERGRELIEDLGARAIIADVFDEAALTEAFAGADAVVNLLTNIPPAERFAEPGAWDTNNRLRREASAAIARAASAAGARRLVQESMVFIYADGGDAWLDEDAPLASAPPTASSLDAERNAAELFAGDTVILRFGLFIGPDSHLTQSDIERARNEGASPSLGARDAYRATVWLDDAAAAVVVALTAPPGTYNVADAVPPTRGEIDAALAAVVGRDALAYTPDVPPAFEYAARSHRISSRRLMDATGWVPQVRAGTEGWRLSAAPLPQPARP